MFLAEMESLPLKELVKVGILKLPMDQHLANGSVTGNFPVPLSMTGWWLSGLGVAGRRLICSYPEAVCFQ